VADIQSFPPVADDDIRLLILGSIPGKASLDAGQYYAHPRNQFWPIMAELLGCGPLNDYSAKLQALLAAHIGLWDVMKSCYRPGSLDAAIDKQSVVANDFAGFFESHPGVTRVYFNGATAEQAFRRLVLSDLNGRELTFQRLPSTSPAHAAMSFRQKCDVWSKIIAIK
jgi:TDG/mug DNA glycosylase family protein